MAKGIIKWELKVGLKTEVLVISLYKKNLDINIFSAMMHKKGDLTEVYVLEDASPVLVVIYKKSDKSMFAC